MKNFTNIIVDWINISQYFQLNIFLSIYFWVLFSSMFAKINIFLIIEQYYVLIFGYEKFYKYYCWLNKHFSILLAKYFSNIFSKITVAIFRHITVHKFTCLTMWWWDITTFI